MNTDISVIIPVYNVEQYLSKCLDSVINQDFDSFEIIIVDDGSTDGSMKIAKEYATKYQNKIKLIIQENKGLGGARNTGIREANGNYIMFVDSDDSIKQGSLSYLYDEIQKADADIAFFGIEFVKNDGTVNSILKPTENERIITSLEEDPICCYIDPSVCSKLFKTSLFKDNNLKFTEKVWYEDLRLLPKLALKSNKLVFLNRVCYSYLQRDGSIMHNANIEKNSDMLNTIKDVIGFYKENNSFEKYYSPLEFMTVFHMMILCSMRVAGTDPKNHLLKDFRNYSKEIFPDFMKNKFIESNLSKRHKLILKLSEKKLYFAIYIIVGIYSKIKK